jgi:hypothetical protein
MFCSYCGAESKAPGALFCAKCGKPLSVGIDIPTATGPAVLFKGLSPGQVQSKPWVRWPFWLLLLCVAMSASGFLLLSFAGRYPLPPGVILGPVIWTGALLAYVRKKQGQSGWVGFGLGALVGYALLTALSLGTAALRMHQAEQELGFIPDADKPQDNIDPKDPLGLESASAPALKFVDPDRKPEPLPFER